MANLQRLTDWVLPKLAPLNITVGSVKWIEEWFPGYFDYRLTMPFNGEVCVGRGIASIKESAFEKAATELFERASVKFPEFKMCPWATAGFPDFDGAAKRAYFELLGIDRVLSHHFCKKRFVEIPIDVIKEKVRIHVLQKNLFKNKIEFALYELAPAKDARVVTAIAWGSKAPHPFPGFIAGFGCGEELSEISLHATLECLRTAVAVFVDGVSSNESLDVLKTARNPWWHIWMSLSQESEEYFKKHLLPVFGLSGFLSGDDVSIRDVEFIEINTLKKVFHDIPLVFVQAKSDNLLRPQFGEFLLDAAVLKRLNRFAGHPVTVDTTVPHFYG